MYVVLCATLQGSMRAKRSTQVGGEQTTHEQKSHLGEENPGSKFAVKPITWQNL